MVKETVNRMKRQPTEWEKLFSNGMTDKGLISKIYKHLIQLKEKKNGQKNWIDIFPETECRHPVGT